MALSTSTRQKIEQHRDRYPHPRSAILPALWEVQHEQGYVTPEGMAEVATLLRLQSSEVEAVATFYSMYFRAP
ncbi:MAG TPA: NAD(P)H-dependent oxidoreductase subunit E, partial [Candidatus Sulfotelmatobacter sp.]|nr:NAD(P)H-dependent oxidoreductase subunit E [Candidatus Sulfotelmatobacter sp.]